MEAEVTRVLGQTKAYRERAGRLNSSNRVNAFESINEYEERMKGKVTNEDRHFYETSPFALANDDFAMYVSRHNSDNYLLSSRISLVFEDGEKHGEKGFEHVNRDLEGMIRILRSKDLKHSFAVLQQALEIRKELERGRYVVAHAIAEGIDPDKYGVHDKLELLLEEHGVTGKMENMYMERAHQAYIWGDWKNCLKHSNLAQEIDRDHDSEIERIAHLSRTMIDIENARARDDYVVAMALYDNAIALMDGHVWNDNQRFSDLKNITREVAAKDLKKKAKKATVTDRAVLLEQWSHVDPTASKTWTFRRLSKKEKKGIFSLFARR